MFAEAKACNDSGDRTTISVSVLLWAGPGPTSTTAVAVSTAAGVHSGGFTSPVDGRSVMSETAPATCGAGTGVAGPAGKLSAGTISGL